jgi:hypothetical protein
MIANCYSLISAVAMDGRVNNQRAFLFDERRIAARARPVLLRIPPLEAASVIRIERRWGLRDGHGPVHAGSFLRQRRIAFDCRAGEFARVFVHEVFHFVWLRLGNPRRLSYERLLRGEFAAGARGELGWSAEWRKLKLKRNDVTRRSRRWREYCCESFCDSAAALYSGVGKHEEFTLGRGYRAGRGRWFAELTRARELSI